MVEPCDRFVFSTPNSGACGQLIKISYAYLLRPRWYIFPSCGSNLGNPSHGNPVELSDWPMLPIPDHGGLDNLSKRGLFCSGDQQGPKFVNAHTVRVVGVQITRALKKESKDIFISITVANYIFERLDLKDQELCERNAEIAYKHEGGIT